MFLAGSYGLQADEWQEHVLEGWLGTRADGAWAAPRCGLAVPRQNGKNGALEVRELHGMVTLAERVLHTAHEVKTARKAFLRLASFFENEREHPELAGLVREVRRTNGQEAIVLRNGGSCEFIARSKGSGRGFSADVLVLDEAQELSDDSLAALLPTISASENPQQILTGTPPGPSANGEVFTRMRDEALQAGSRRLCWLEWSCDGQADLDLDDRALWAQANPALGVRLSYEFTADERLAFDDETFARERLGVWGGTAANRWTVIREREWRDLLDRDSAPQDPVAFGVDVSPDRKRTTISLAGRRPDGLLHLEVVQSEPGTGWAAERLADLQAKWKPCAIVLDPASPAGALLSDIQDTGVQPLLTSTRDVGQACGAFQDVVTEGRLRHLGDPRLATALAMARKRALGDSGAWAWHRRDSTTDLTPLVAATLALHGYLVNARKSSGPKRVTGRARSY